MKSALAAITLLCLPLVSQASTFAYFQTSYTIDLTRVPSPVTNILVEESPGAPFAQRLNYLGPQSGIAGASQVTTLDNPFLNTSPNPNTVSLGMGIVQDLPNDAPGQQHIVLFMNSAASLLANGLDWGALFPDTLEDQLIANLQLGTSGGLNWGNSFDTLAPGLLVAAAFLNSLASPGGLPGPGGNLTSPYFDLPAPGQPASDFVVVAFSTGQIIGSGSVIQTFFTDAPEPATFGLGSLAFAALLRLRRRK